MPNWKKLVLQKAIQILHGKRERFRAALRNLSGILKRSYASTIKKSDENWRKTSKTLYLQQGRRNRGVTGATCSPKFYKVPLFHKKVPFFQCGLCAIVPFSLFSFKELENMIAVVSLDKQFTCASLPTCTVKPSAQILRLHFI